MRRFLFFTLLFFFASISAKATTGTATYTAAGVGSYNCNWSVVANTTARTVTIILEFEARPDGNPWPAYSALGWNRNTSDYETSYMNSYVDVRLGGTRSVTDVAYTTGTTDIKLYFAWFGNEAVTPITVTVPLQDSPQTCVISNTSAPDISGHTITGTATGSHAGNPYNISIVSGPASAAINSTTGAYSITATGAGAIVYKVWISGGSGYLRSNDASGRGTSGASNKVTVTIPANNSTHSQTFTLIQGGETVGSYTQPPDSGAYILQIDVGANSGPVTMNQSVNGVKFQDGVYIEDPTSSADTGVVTTLTPTTTPPTTPPTANTAPISNAPSPSNNNQTSGNIWNNTPPATDPTTGSPIDGLTNAVYRQGVDQQVKAIQGVNSSILTGNATLTGISNSLTSSSSLPSDPSDEPDPSTATADNLPGLVDNVLAKLPAAPTIAPLTAVSPTFTMPPFSIHGQEYSATYDLSPYTSELNVFRNLCIGIMSILFFIAYYRTVKGAFAS